MAKQPAKSKPAAPAKQGSGSAPAKKAPKSKKGKKK